MWCNLWHQSQRSRASWHRWVNLGPPSMFTQGYDCSVVHSNQNTNPVHVLCKTLLECIQEFKSLGVTSQSLATNKSTLMTPGMPKSTQLKINPLWQPMYAIWQGLMDGTPMSSRVQLILGLYRMESLSTVMCLEALNTTSWTIWWPWPHVLGSWWIHVYHAWRNY